MTDRLLTTAETADWLNVNEQTLRNWRTTGGGPPAVKVGRHVRYRPSAVNAWLDANTETRTPSPSLRSVS